MMGQRRDAAEVRLVADAMLGRLAKWLRVMGYDTHYQSSYREGIIPLLIQEGRVLLSRDGRSIGRYGEAAVPVRSNHLRGQLQEVRTNLPLTFSRSGWFSRCLICNLPLQTAPLDRAQVNTPDYVFHEYAGAIRYCPSCGRYYWPGSHRHQMRRQLEAWGF
jgi:uncharacterized protein with PIN domain